MRKIGLLGPEGTFCEVALNKYLNHVNLKEIDINFYQTISKVSNHINDNDLKPAQQEIFSERSMYLHDDTGYISNPYLIYFKEGENTITFESLRENLVVFGIELTEQVTTDSYEDYIAEYANEEKVKDFMQEIQAQDSFERSSPTLYPTADRTSPLNYPSHPVKTKYNSIGGSRWSTPGDWVAWEVEVPKSGLYQISFRAKQDLARGLFSTRKVLVNGEVPFKEANNARFYYGSEYDVVTIGNQNGEAFYFYLEEGKNSIALQATIGDYGELISLVQGVVDDLNELYLKIIKRTTANPDEYQEYNLYGDNPSISNDEKGRNMVEIFRDSAITLNDVFKYSYGSFILEVTDDVTDGKVLGTTTDKFSISLGEESVCLCELEKAYEEKLESVYSCNIAHEEKDIKNFEYSVSEHKSAAIKVATPKVVIPVFPGTNCEFDSAKAVEDAGAKAEIIVINNLTADGISRSVEKFAKAVNDSQMIFVPGGFSGGDEPDGSGKFITAFFRNDAVKVAVTDLLDNRDGLMCGICNGFQALIKLGLVPYGKIIDTDENCPTLTYNTISRHQSKIVRTRIASNKSPWLSLMNVGDIVNVPISHGEGRFYASEDLIKTLAENGQIATQYVDLSGNATTDVQFNPNDSAFAIEGITSPDGRVFGKMGHSERIGAGLYKNVDGEYNIRMFESAVKYFK